MWYAGGFVTILPVERRLWHHTFQKWKTRKSHNVGIPLLLVGRVHDHVIKIPVNERRLMVPDSVSNPCIGNFFMMYSDTAQPNALLSATKLAQHH